MGLPESFARIAAGFAGALGSPFADVTLRWPGTPAYDDGGSITAPGAPILLSARAQFDMPGEQMRADPQFRERDMSVIVLRAGLERELDTTPIMVVASGRHAGTWSIETCQGDSAGIGWECRARKVA